MQGENTEGGYLKSLCLALFLIEICQWRSYYYEGGTQAPSNMLVEQERAGARWLASCRGEPGKRHLAHLLSLASVRLQNGA